jgi:hypothetical protein
LTIATYILVASPLLSTSDRFESSPMIPFFTHRLATSLAVGNALVANVNEEIPAHTTANTKVMVIFFMKKIK